MQAIEAGMQAIEAGMQAIEAGVQAIEAGVQAIEARMQAIQAMIQTIEPDFQAKMQSMRVQWKRMRCKTSKLYWKVLGGGHMQAIEAGVQAMKVKIEAIANSQTCCCFFNLSSGFHSVFFSFLEYCLLAALVASLTSSFRKAKIALRSSGTSLTRRSALEGLVPWHKMCTTWPATEISTT